MVRHAVTHLAVFSAILWLAAPNLHAATQQSDELKQIKADIKLALAQAKTGTDGALSVFTDEINILLTKIKNGTEPLANVADDLADKVLTAVHDIQAATRNASNDASTQIASHATVPIANAVLPGGGGDFDKFRTSQDSLMAKALKKMQSLLKKFQKSATSSSPSPFAVNVVLLPFSQAQGIFSDHDTSPSSNAGPLGAVSVLIGTSTGGSTSGIALIGGLNFGGLTLTVNSVDVVVPFTQIWTRKLTSQTPGNNISFAVSDPTPDVLIGFQAIGIPVP